MGGEGQDRGFEFEKHDIIYLLKSVTHFIKRDCSIWKCYNPLILIDRDNKSAPSIQHERSSQIHHYHSLCVLPITHYLPAGSQQEEPALHPNFILLCIGKSVQITSSSKLGQYAWLRDRQPLTDIPLRTVFSDEYRG